MLECLKYFKSFPPSIDLCSIQLNHYNFMPCDSSAHLQLQFYFSSVSCCCFVISDEKISSNLMSQLDKYLLVCCCFSTSQVRIFGSVSISPHPSGHVLSVYRPPKSFLMPRTVLVLRASRRLTFSLLNLGLVMYDAVSNCSYLIFSILECDCCTVLRYSNAALSTLSKTKLWRDAHFSRP